MSVGFLDIQIRTSASDVENALQRVNSAFSTEGLSEWMGVELAGYVQERTRKRFQLEGDDVSGKWAPLLPQTLDIRSYLAERYGIEPDHPINVRTGDLMEYMTSGFGKVIPLESGGTVFRYPGGQPRGELRDKISTAQRGKHDPQTVPRPVLGLNDQDFLWIITSLAWHIRNKASIK